MEFNEKLQELRKQKGLTQEELAEILFVSRAAVSKWESGRGYPNIDSLRAIANYYSVTIDELLSSGELLTIAEEDRKQKENHFRDLLFGVLDCSMAMFFFLPVFGERMGDLINEVSLLSMLQMAPYLKIPYFIMVVGMIVCGILTLALKNCEGVFWVRNKHKISLLLSSLSAVIFMSSLQPYAAVMVFVFLIIKVLMLIKWQ